MKRIMAFLAAMLLFAAPALGESLSLEEMLGAQEAQTLAQEQPVQEETAQQSGAREELINRYLALAKTLYEEAGGKAKRAQYSGDIYVCKNFSVHIFRETCGDFAMAEYPDVPLVIPNNQKKEDCAPYVYGVEWQDVPAEEGNPFYAAASFRYNDELTKAENQQLAREFLSQVQRGDYFQMAANYYYGVGAHSMVFTSDYDPETDTVMWTDSNMKGKSIGGERYAYVQYDAQKDIDWFVDAFCRKKYGATIYRLREDIIFAN